MECRPFGTLSAWAIVAALCLGRPVEGQGAPAQRFTTGGRDIVNMTFGATQIGELPTGLKLLRGSVDVVDVNGTHMLRASSEAELELPLPQNLPQDFTVEFEFIPKQCCNPQDLAIEGTSVGHSNPGSAQITWHRNRLTVIGGGESFATEMPEVLANSTPGTPTVVSIVWEGPTVKLYTNGRRLYTLADRKFVRAQKLWIYLGGQDDGAHAVYVSRIRVVDNVPPVGPVVASNPLPPAAGGGIASTAPVTGVPATTTGTAVPATAAPAPTAPASSAPVTVAPATTTGTATPMAAPSTGSTAGPTSAAPSSTSRTTTAMSMLPCTATTTPGPTPATLTATAQWPSGLAFEWKGGPTDNYSIDRAPDGTTNWTFVGSTCGGPSQVRKVDNGNGFWTYSVRDVSGGVNGNQVYRVTMIGAGGQTGWNTLHWPAPCAWTPSASATVSGSTITLKWFAGSPPCSSKMPGVAKISGPDGYTITSSYGYTKTVWAGVTSDMINGVPLGTHTFTITSNWTPDKSASRTLNVSVKY